MKRIFCLWLPNWPIQRLVVARPELKGRAVLLRARVGGHGERVAARSPEAQAGGVCVGMSLAEAAALLRKSQRRQKRIAQLEEEIAQIEEQLEDLEMKMSAPEVARDYPKLQEFHEQADDLKKRLDEKYTEWESLSQEELQDPD